MSQVGSRKRPAPGARPISEQSSQHQFYDDQYNRPRIPGNEQLMPWNSEETNNAPYYANMAASLQTETYGSMAVKSPKGNASQQLARRPANQQILSRAHLSPGPNEAWPSTVQTSSMTGLEEFQIDENSLAQRALQAKRERKSIPPFVQKLSSFLDSSSNNADKTDLIRWSDNGDSFVVLDEDEFARTLIPELFKHNNYASFVRQLNMYGFHKKVGLSDNSMRASERKNKSPSEYYNAFFKRGQPNLLWLISKPKAGGKSKVRGKGDDNAFDDDGEEVFDDQPPSTTHLDDAASGRVPRQPLMIGGMPPEELSAVHRELNQVRQQQAMITAAFQRIRREHEQLYNQATAFQDLHNRHENSINAILTFLATVYNRSLEGHGGQNGSSLSSLFAEAIPDLQPAGSVVDVGGFGHAAKDGAHNPSRRPSRKQPLLLQAPPTHPSVEMGSSRTTPMSAAASPGHFASPQPSYGVAVMNNMSAGKSSSIREIKEQESTVHATPSPGYSGYDANTPRSEPDIMSFINSANAIANGRKSPGIGSMNFPQALSHLQTADGKTPLSPSQRSTVLQLLSGPAGVSGNDNALTNPGKPDVLNMPDWTANKSELDQLERRLKEQNDKVALLTGMVQPLSPSGSIPGLNDGYVPALHGDGLDFDQIFNNDYFNDATVNNNVELNFGDPIDFGDTATFDFGSSNGATTSNGLDTEAASALKRIVETVDSSEATSPANTNDEAGQEEVHSPRKRRRRN